jgi:DNA-binding MarR family transcriptional regulator
MTGKQVEARYSFSGLDRVFHERARLGIATSLAGHPEGLPFSQLKRLCGLTDGNLARHLLVLSEAGYVSTRKDTTRSRTLTICGLTEFGRRCFAEYLGELELALREGTQAAVSGRSFLPRNS